MDSPRPPAGDLWGSGCAPQSAPSSAIGSTCAIHGSPRASACCTPPTTPIVSTTPPGESGNRRSTTVCKPSAPATARSRVGSGPTGMRRSRLGPLRVQLRTAELVRAFRGGTSGRARAGRAVRLVLFRQIPAPGPGCRAGAQPHLCERCGCAPRPPRLLSVLNPQGGIEADLTRHPADRRLLFDRDRRGHGSTGLRLAATTHSGRRPLCGEQCDFGPGGDFDHGSERSGAVQSLTPNDLSHEAFPFAHSREIELGYALVRASRITYVGELGWETLHPHPSSWSASTTPSPPPAHRSAWPTPAITRWIRYVSKKPIVIGPRHHRRRHPRWKRAWLRREVRQGGRVHRPGGAAESQGGRAAKRLLQFRLTDHGRCSTTTNPSGAVTSWSDTSRPAPTATPSAAPSASATSIRPRRRTRQRETSASKWPGNGYRRRFSSTPMYDPGSRRIRC